MKGTGLAADPLLEPWDGGFDWIAHPDEGMQRASHALSADGAVWLVDPVDAAGIDDHVADLGSVAGVVVLLDRHTRDAAVFAARHDVPVYVPSWMGGVEDAFAAPVERFDAGLPDTDYRLRRVVDNRLWREGALVGGDGTLVVPEAVGTVPYFRAGDERLGVHPMLRPFPPRRAFRDLSPERVLVGHGPSVFEDAASALHEALANARRRAPRAYAGALKALLG